MRQRTMAGSPSKQNALVGSAAATSAVASDQPYKARSLPGVIAVVLVAVATLVFIKPIVIMAPLWKALTTALWFTVSIGAVPASDANTKTFPKLIDADLEQLSAGLARHDFTSVDLVKAYSARISEVNGTLSVVTEINPDALAIAKQLDEERAKGKLRGPLHGIPFLIKNNIATADKMTTSAGSYAIKGARPPADATVASKLRAAGAVILGKSNLSQWANFRSDNSSNGWSAYGGQCIGAYADRQDPCGSSSGSGVATSIGLALAALGTETSGSIICPSEANNIVGIKPTVGLTSRALVVPISQRQDTVGPMAKSVKDAAYLLQAIAGVDPKDNYTLASPFRKTGLPDYVAACKTNALVGKRIGIPRNLIVASPGIGPEIDAFNKALDVIRALGATIVDNANVTAFSADQTFNGNSTTNVLYADFISDLPGEYLSKLVTNPNNIHNVAQVRQFTQKTKIEDYPERNTAEFDGALALGYNNTSPQFWPQYQNNLEVAGPQGILGVLKNRSLDALILPSDISYIQPALVGTPIVTVPLGAYPKNSQMVLNPPRNDLVDIGPNIPFGLSFIGRAWSEAELIGYAYAFEQKTKVRNTIKPKVVPKTELADVVNSCS